MNLIDGNSRFSKSVTKEISRSIIDRDNTLLTSFSAGKLVPIYLDEVLPGDTVTMDMSMVCRMATPLYPVMDTAWIDVHWFFVPARLLWDNWKYFMGESPDAWDSDINRVVPTDSPEQDGKDFYSYAGLPFGHVPGNTQAENFVVNALPRRAYQLIWNEWYRDQNLQDAILVDKGDTGLSNQLISLLPVNKYKDYFTSALIEPQKGNAVPLPVNVSNMMPVYTRAETVPDYGTIYPLRFNQSGGLASDVAFNLLLKKDTSNGLSALRRETTSGISSSSVDTSDNISPANLWAMASLDDTYVGTINDLRQAFAVQRLLELDARGGTRYRELVKAHFGVDVGDSRVQVPEYLGGVHVPINIQQVVQQSSTSSEPSPLGETGAMSKTVHKGSMFTKSFVEHGYLMAFASVRTQHSYQQGIHKMWSRSSRFDFYWPELANIGEQAILNKEIFAISAPQDDEVFGYQEAWADYRYKPNMITGNMRQYADSLDTDKSLAVWHYGDFYESVPRLSDEWVRETDTNVARTLAVSDTAIFDQFLADFYFKGRWARPMPLYSIPGLSGHF